MNSLRHLGLGGFATNRADGFSQGEPDLTPHEFERLCAELAELDHKAEVTDHRRKGAGKRRGEAITKRGFSRLISDVLFLFYMFYLIAVYKSLKPTDKYYYGYQPEHSN